MIKLLLFDLDGTLIDTSRDIAAAVNYAVEPFGISPLSIEIVKSMVGSGITKLLENLVAPETSSKNSPPAGEVINRFLEHYSKHLLDNTVPYPHVKETLLKLGAYKKAVISNKRELFSKQVLDGLGFSGFFDLILGSDSITEKKPSPVPVYEALKRTGVSKDEAVIIGDSNFDIDAGRAAGVKTIAVTYGFRSREVLKDADYMINSFDMLISLLPEINNLRRSRE